MNKRLFLTIGLAAGLMLLVALALAGRPARAHPPCTRFVLNVDSSDIGNNCADEAHPCRTVQHAINQAVNGDVICIADHSVQPGPSIYTGTIVITKNVTLDGAWEGACAGTHPMLCELHPVPCNPSRVILDAQRLGRVISITNASPTIHCFTITGGNAGGAAGDPNHGGGIAARDAAPIILSNIITGNSGCIFTSCTGYGRGGGIYLADAPATAVISGNLITNNWADNTSTWGQGGGIYMTNSSAQVISNVIQVNRAGTSAGDGGGIFVTDGSPTIADNQIMTNTSGTGVMCHGGGIFVQSNTPVTIERNLIQANRALYGTGDPTLINRGGGIYFDGHFAVIRDNKVYGNVAAVLDERGLGGGMYLRDLSAAAEVRGNVIANDNRASYVRDGNGGGIYLDNCYATVADNQVFNNIASSETPGYGGGIYVNGGGGLIQGNVITRNMAVLGAVGGWGWGGGMAISGSTVLVQDNLIARNIADSAPNAIGAGGGVYVWAGAPRLVGNDVLSNTTSGGGGGFGGGLALSGASPWLEGNTILDNRAVGTAGDSGGGGVRVASCHIFTLTNNIIARNTVSTTGSGVLIIGSGAIRGRAAHNTIVANLAGDGVGFYVGVASTVRLYNNIIVSQTVGITNAAMPTSTVIADHTLFEGNGVNYGSGVTSTNEVAGPAGLLPDYHLGSGSNAIDHAAALNWVTSDIDGDARPLGPAADVGADERRLYGYLPLVLRNY